MSSGGGSMAQFQGNPAIVRMGSTRRLLRRLYHREYAGAHGAREAVPGRTNDRKIVSNAAAGAIAGASFSDSRSR